MAPFYLIMFYAIVYCDQGSYCLCKDVHIHIVFWYLSIRIESGKNGSLQIMFILVEKYENKVYFKQWLSSIPPISTKRTITSHLNNDHLSSQLNSPNTIITTIYDVGNTCSDLGQAQKYGRVRPVNVRILTMCNKGRCPSVRFFLLYW